MDAVQETMTGLGYHAPPQGSALMHSTLCNNTAHSGDAWSYIKSPRIVLCLECLSLALGDSIWGQEYEFVFITSQPKDISADTASIDAS